MKTIVLSLVSALTFAGSAGLAEVPAPAEIDLNAALSLALENNFAIRQARARYAEATGVVTEYTAAALPTVGITSGYSRVDDSLRERFGNQPAASPTAWQAQLQASQTVYAGGAVSSGIRAARATREAAQADFQSALETALLNVRERYYDVLLAREQVGVQEEAVRLLEEELGTARSRVRAGSGSPFDELRAEVAVANGQPPLIRARNGYRLAAVELLRTIGLPAEEGIEDRIIGAFAFDDRLYELEPLITSAHANRPEVHQLEQIVEASSSLVGTARAGARPQVAVVAGYGVQKSSFSNDLGDTLDGWTVGVQGSWNIWDGNATRGRVAQARSRAAQAQLNLDETLLAIDAEVRQAFSSYREARELVSASRRVVDQADESLRLARSRFGAGAATQLDVLTAQVALTEARSNAALALHDVNIALARLERAAGLAEVPALTP